MLKKFLSLTLVLITVTALAACGGTTQKPPASSQAPSSSAPTGYYVYGYDHEENPIALGTPENALNPETVYQNLTYIPQMFYGNYKLPGGDTAREKFAADISYIPFTQKGKEYEVTALPLGMEAGRHTFSHVVHDIEGYDWARLSYMQKSANDGKTYLFTLVGAYTIAGSSLTFRPLDNWVVDDENNKISYEFSETEFTYDFQFSGRALTFTEGSQSVTLYTGLDMNGGISLRSRHYVSSDSRPIEEIDGVDFSYSESYDSSTLSLSYASWGETPRAANAGIGCFEENGLFTFTIPWETGTKTYQYIYFLCGDDGVILTDGENTYCYNDNYADRNMKDLNKYLSEEQAGKLNDMTENELEAIVEKKDNLMDELAQAFRDAGIQVTIDPQSGELQMDASVLFGGDSAVLTDTGKAFLDKFVDVYTGIVFSEKYDGFVEKTMVEGHAAPIDGATYEYGLPLSEERANNVKDYCISAQTGSGKLAASLEAIGYSNSRPVLDDDGNVDSEASRRVSFRIIINLGDQY